MALWVTMAGGVDAVPLGVSLYSAMSRNPGLLMYCRRMMPRVDDNEHGKKR